MKKLKDYYHYFRFLFFVKPQKDTWYFALNHYAAGDVYILCSLINAFKEEHKADKIVLLIHPANHADVISLFDTQVQVKRYLIAYPSLPVFLEFKKGAIINLHHFFYMKSITRLMGYKKMTLVDIFKLLLDVPMTSQLILPAFAATDDKVTFAEKLFTANGLRKGKTIIIAPEANSLQELDIDLWVQLAEKLKDCGYDVALSALKPVYHEALKIPVIKFSFLYATAVVDYAGYFISMRSGFCDIVSSSKGLKIILYPKIHWRGGSVIDATTLVEMNPEGNHRLIELEYEQHSTAQLIENILKSLN